MIIENLFVENFEDLNDTDLYIWNYVKEHPLEVEDMTIDQLALECNVSRTTILRFTKKLRLKGFKEFKSYLKLDNRASQTTSVIDQFTNMYIEVTKLFANKDLTDLFDRIYSSKNIYVFANSHASSIKKELVKKFLPYNKFIIDLADYLETNVLVDSLSEEDLFILLSTNEPSEDMLKILRKLEDKNISSLTITGVNIKEYGLSPAYNLYIPSSNINLGEDTKFVSVASYFIIVELIALKYGLYLEEKNDRKTSKK